MRKNKNGTVTLSTKDIQTVLSEYCRNRNCLQCKLHVASFNLTDSCLYNKILYHECCGDENDYYANLLAKLLER